MHEGPRRLYLHKNRHKRLASGHLWVFSNEVDTDRTRLRDFAPGEVADIYSASGAFLARGYVNPHSLIAARMLSGKREDVPALLEQRLESALALRQRLYPEPFYRLAFSEGDFLPGLVADRFGDTLVLQLNTAGMEGQRERLLDMLSRLLPLRGLVLKNDTGSRELEGLETGVETVGDAPEEAVAREAGLEFLLPLLTGQKTGWFFDQAPNRDSFSRLCPGARVLDVFSYLGAVSAAALSRGAEEVTAVDSSEAALQYLEHNLQRNRLPVDRARLLRGDAFNALADLAREGRQFEAVSLDPPAFIKRKRDHAAGRRAYEKLNALGLDLLAPGGFLMTCSCSQHLQRQELLNILARAASKKGREMRIIRFCHQGPDHPVLPAMPETEYLKGVVAQVL